MVEGILGPGVSGRAHRPINYSCKILNDAFFAARATVCSHSEASEARAIFGRDIGGDNGTACAVGLCAGLPA
jgi:hypothetical protein